jgi:ATP-dependent Clp endopeptidase proteolytic subunit ClpP
MKTIRFNVDQSRNWGEIKNVTAKAADLYIYDEIGWFGVSAADFINEIKSLKVETINLFINSPGGSVFDGVAIYNTLKNHPAAVNVQIDGLAASIASVIAMAGDTITIADNAMMMIHKPAVLMFGQAPDLRKEADLLDQIEQQIISTYAARTGTESELISAMMQEETWFAGNEAVTHGFADAVTEGKQRAASANVWDLSLYDNAPEQDVDESNPVTPLSLLLRRQALTEKLNQNEETENE